MPAAVKVRFASWNDIEYEQRAASLRAAGFEVAPLRGSADELREMDAAPPAAVVIDLSRLPSHGRSIGWVVRERKGTRRIPLVFVGGETNKVDRVRRVLPDATFTTWARVRRTLKGAVARPPQDPVVPVSTSGGYSGTPLPKKLGIRESWTVGLIGAPRDFATVLGSLPNGARLVRSPRSPCDLLVWFVTSEARLLAGVDRAKALFNGGLWIAWPKQASGVRTDLKEQTIRKAALERGLVDYKVCAIDTTWSGLKFAIRAR